MMHAELTQTGVAVLTGTSGIVVSARSAPVIAPDEIAVRVEAVGIWGYETAGRVVHLGSSVTTHRVGDRVAVVPGVPCGACTPCRTAHPSLCSDVEHPAMRAADGTLHHYITVPEHAAITLPDAVPTERGALLAPLALAVAACRTAAVSRDSHVLITGAGAVGLLVLQVARAFGASRVTVTDLDPHRLRLAADLGADGILEAAALATDVAIDPDVHIDCTGDARAVRDGISWLAPRGTSVMLGVGADRTLELPFSWVLEKELVITGVSRTGECFPLALELLVSGAVQLDRISCTTLSMPSAANH